MRERNVSVMDRIDRPRLNGLGVKFAAIINLNFSI